MPTPRRALGYARVSSAEQAVGTSLGDQQTAISAYAATRGLKVARFFVEAESAIHEKLERREQMKGLLAEAREGDLVLCYRLDRWSRDPEFTYRSVRELLAKGCAFYATDDRCDPSTSEGDTALGFRILFAREEHKRIKERMVGTRQKLRDRGYFVEGLPPIGYRRQDVRGIERNVLVVHQEEAEVVRQIFARAIAGQSMQRIAMTLGLARDRVHDVLGRRLYVGEIRSSANEWIAGMHPPIVTRMTFARARAAVEGRTLGGRREKSASSVTSTWLLRDVAACAHCGGKMAAAYAGPTDARRTYYRCHARCVAAYVHVDLVEYMVADMVGVRLAELRDELGRPPAVHEPGASTDWPAKLAKVAAKRERVLEMYADGVIAKSERDGKLEAIATERAKLEAHAAAEAPGRLSDASTRAEALRSVRALQHAWEASPAQRRRQIAHLLIVSVAMAQGADPIVTWRSAEDLAVDA